MDLTTIGGIVYASSVFLYLALVYLVTRELRVSNIVVSLIPVANSVGFLYGSVYATIETYRKYEGVVLVGKGVKKVPKPKRNKPKIQPATETVKSSPKSKKVFKVPKPNKKV